MPARRWRGSVSRCGCRCPRSPRRCSCAMPPARDHPCARVRASTSARMPRAWQCAGRRAPATFRTGRGGGRGRCRPLQPAGGACVGSVAASPTEAAHAGGVCRAGGQGRCGVVGALAEMVDGWHLAGLADAGPRGQGRGRFGAAIGRYRGRWRGPPCSMSRRRWMPPSRNRCGWKGAGLRLLPHRDGALERFGRTVKPGPRRRSGIIRVPGRRFPFDGFFLEVAAWSARRADRAGGDLPAHTGQGPAPDSGVSDVPLDIPAEPGRGRYRHPRPAAHRRQARPRTARSACRQPRRMRPAPRPRRTTRCRRARPATTWSASAAMPAPPTPTRSSLR